MEHNLLENNRNEKLFVEKKNDGNANFLENNFLKYKKYRKKFVRTLISSENK